MADNTDVGDKTLDKTSESKAGDAGAAQTEASGGMKDLSDNTKSYYEARKGGMRDKDTQEHLGAQPQFFDSSLATNQSGPPGDKGSADKGADGNGSPDKGAGDSKSDIASMATNQMGKPGDTAEDGAKPEEKSAIVRDDQDRVKHIDYPDGTTADVKYGADNKASEIKSLDGTWKNEKDGWNCYDDKNKKTNHLDGDMQVNEQGDIIAKQKNGYTETYSPDGTLVKEGFGDKHKETLYGDGRWMTEDAKGDRAYYQKDGTKTVYGDDKTTVTHPDRSVSEMYPDGRVKTTDENGKVSEYHPDKSDWHFPEQGLPAQYDDGTLIYDNDQGDRMYQNPKTHRTEIYRKDVYSPEVYQDGKRIK